VHRILGGLAAVLLALGLIITQRGLRTAVRRCPEPLNEHGREKIVDGAQ